MIILCLLLPLELLGQGRYTIESINGNTSTGHIHINPYFIRITHDSLDITLPITDIVEEGQKTFYLLEGCLNNNSFKGSAMLIDIDRKLRGRYGLVLYIEVRTKNSYSLTRYKLFYFEE
jgi:hypothetical protein